MMSDKNQKETKEKVHHHDFLHNLQRASNEIDSIKDSFTRGMDDLARIQSMLSLEGVNKVSTMIQNFEDRLIEAERTKEEAMAGAKKFSDELEKEKDRLVKLWDAYKNQEEALSSQEKKALDLEEKLRETIQDKTRFEEDVNARIATLTQKLRDKEHETEQLEEFKQRIQEFDTIRNDLEDTIHGLRGQMNGKDETICSLEAQVQELRKFEKLEGIQTKFDDLSREYEKEKERLTKLFRLYEETDAENQRLKKEVKQWQEWFESNEELFTKLFSSADHLRKQKGAETPPPSRSESDDKKAKKKLRLKK